nr:hypothetical protein [Microbacterium lemovicicum]
MARKGDIEIPIAVDTSGVEKSIRNGLIDPVEDAEGALKKLSKADSGDIAKDMDKAQDATKDLSRELDDARDDLKKLGYAAKDAGDDSRKGMDRAKEGVGEFKDEANSTAREAAASFSGSADDIGDAFQEVAANAFAGFGPAGALAGLAAAAGIGVVTAELQRQQEEADKLNERMTEAYQSAAEAGQAYIQEADVIANWQDLIFNKDRAEEYKKVQDTINATGLDRSTIMKANAGDLDALAIVQERITEAWKKEGDEANLFTDGLGTKTQAAKNYWDTVGTAAQTSSDLSKEAIQGVTDYWLEQIAVAGEVAERTDDVGNRIVALPNGKEILIDAKTGQATEDVSRFGTDTDAVINRVNGRDVVLEARASTSAAQRDLDNLIYKNNGRTIEVQYNVRSGIRADLG